MGVGSFLRYLGSSVSRLRHPKVFESHFDLCRWEIHGRGDLLNCLVSQFRCRLALGASSPASLCWPTKTSLAGCATYQLAVSGEARLLVASLANCDTGVPPVDGRVELLEIPGFVSCESR